MAGFLLLDGWAPNREKYRLARSLFSPGPFRSVRWPFVWELRGPVRLHKSCEPGKRFQELL
jgi:hypothetical protein